MTTGGLLVIVIGLIVCAIGWFGALYSHRQVAEHRRRLAREAAAVEHANR